MSKIDLSKLSPTLFPQAEDDVFEFKSSRATPDQIKKKLDKAASAFANSGGGYLIWGVDSSGDADGGVDLTEGRTDLCDWLDHCMSSVTPPVTYDRRLFTEPGLSVRARRWLLSQYNRATLALIWRVTTSTTFERDRIRCRQDIIWLKHCGQDGRYVDRLSRMSCE